MTSSPIPSPSSSSLPPNPTSTSFDDASLETAISPGAIGGIIVGVVAVFVVGLFIFLRRKSKIAKSRLDKSRPRSLGTTIVAPSTTSTRIGADARGTVTLVSQYSKESRVYIVDETPTFSIPESPPPVPPKPEDYALDIRKEPKAPEVIQEIPASPQSQIAGPAPPMPANYLAKVVFTFIRALPDELHIELHQIVRVLTEYDDGWCFCQTRDGSRGMVPLECLEIRGKPSISSPSLSPYTTELSRRPSQRASSLRFSRQLHST